MSGTSINVKCFRTEIPGALTDDNTWSFPTVESANVRGKGTFWRIYVRVVDADGEFVPIDDSYFDSRDMGGLAAWINVDSGLVGGKIKKTVPTIIRAGKNIGRKGATNPLTQALRDAYGIYNKQIKKQGPAAGPQGPIGEAGPEDTSTLYPPMLAQIYKDQKTPPMLDDDHPLYVQRKYNGVRAVATLEEVPPQMGAPNPQVEPQYRVVMYSRTKNLYLGLPYIKAELLPLLKIFQEDGRKLYLDGEIYKHGVALQEISGDARRATATTKYDFNVYDCFIPTEPDLLYSARKDILAGVFEDFQFAHTKLVETFMVHSDIEITQLYDTFLAEDFEGAMVRVDAPYQYSYNARHSKVLLKMKPSFDGEYDVVGFTTGERGKAADALMIICKTPEGIVFPVTPAMEIPDRIALAKKMETVEANTRTHFQNHWEGKQIIVTYDEKSKDNLPLRARTRMQIRTWD